MQFSFRFAAAVAAVALAAPAMAAVTTYTNAADFQAALTGGSFTESFTGVGELPGSNYGNGSFGFQATAAQGLYSVSGNDLSTEFPDDPITITFTTGNVRGVGGNFFLTNFSGGFDNFFDVFIVLSTGDAYRWGPASDASFAGFVSDDVITSITFLPFSNTDTGLYATVDNLTIGNVAQIPEPASLALVGLAIAGLAARRRRTA